MARCVAKPLVSNDAPISLKSAERRSYVRAEFELEAGSRKMEQSGAKQTPNVKSPGRIRFVELNETTLLG